MKVFIKLRQQLNLEYLIDQTLNQTKPVKTSQAHLKPPKSRHKRTCKHPETTIQRQIKIRSIYCLSGSGQNINSAHLDQILTLHITLAFLSTIRKPLSCSHQSVLSQRKMGMFGKTLAKPQTQCLISIEFLLNSL